jgi:ATP/maltotriose-dependent transcriptional regulator MalT
VKHKLATVSLIAATVELTIGDAVAAERHMRSAYETLVAMGERGWLPAAAGLLAHTLVAQGRDEEADKLIVVSEASSHHKDVYIRVTSRVTRALVLARRGDISSATTLARLADEQARETDWPMLRAYVSLVLGVLLQQSGARDEAAASLRNAIEACEEKGDVVTAGRARFLLERLG